MRNTVAVFCLVFGLSLLMRLLFLFFGIDSVTFDEADFYYNGYLLSRTGSELFGHRLFLTSGILFATPSIPIYVSALFWKFVPFKSVLFARLPFALLNSLTPAVLFLVVYKVSRNKLLAFLTAMVFSFSPWFSHLSSTAGFDAPVSVLFLLLSSLVLLSRMDNRLKAPAFILFSFLSFNSYMGIKIIFFPVLFILMLTVEATRGKVTPYLALRAGLVSLLLFFSFLAMAYLAPNAGFFKSRATNEITFLNKQKVEGDVWYARYSSRGDPLLNTLMFNKVSLPLADFQRKYMEAFNFKVLFTQGDPHPIYGTNLIGQFHFLDFLFLIMGIIVFRRTLNRATKILLALVFVGGIPTAININAPTIALRGIILLIPYSLMIATGLYHLVRKPHSLFRPAVIGLYLFSTIYFLLIYQTRIKVLSAEQWHQSDRLIVQDLHRRTEPKRIFTNEPREFYLLYNFYNDTPPEQAKKELLKGGTSYRTDGLLVTDGCPENSGYRPDRHTLVLIRPEYCQYPDPSRFEVLNYITSREGDRRTLYYLTKGK